MVLKLGFFTVAFNDWPLEKVLEHIKKLGYEAVELAAWKGSNHLNIDKVLSGGAGEAKNLVEKYGLFISALSNHLEGQLVLGPLDESTDEWFKGTPDEKVKYGIMRMKKTAEAAAQLDVSVVCGFTGHPNWAAWYIFPPAYEKMWDKYWELFEQRWGDILDHFAAHGIKFAHEVHPQEMAYNIYTAKKAIEVIKRKEFGFNFDPSHLVWQLIDPVVFIHTFGDRIYHMHAKDVEVVQEAVATDGVLSTGPWRRLGRGMRFRVPGWGNVNWRRLITALIEVGYDYVMSYEHEDPVMSPEDGVEKNIQFLKPLIIKKPLEKVWW